MAVVQSGNELGLAVLRALGVDPRGVLRVSLSMNSSEPATVTIERKLDKVEGERFVTELQHFALHRIDPDAPAA